MRYTLSSEVSRNKQQHSEGGKKISIPANELWKDCGRREQRYVAYPCFGVSPFFTGHTYQIDDCSGEIPDTVGFMDLLSAVKKFGPRDLYVSKSAAICPLCHKIFLPPFKVE